MPSGPDTPAAAPTALPPTAATAPASSAGARAARRLAGDLWDPRTYARLAYLLIGFPLAVSYFVFVVTGISLGLGMAITLAGIPILLAMLVACRGLANLERWLVGTLLGAPIQRPYRPAVEPRLWQRTMARLADPATWKDLVYLCALMPLSTVTFSVVVALGSTALGLLSAPLWYWSLPDGDGIVFGVWQADTLPKALLLVPIGAVLTVLAAKVVTLLGALHAGFARLMLGSSPDPVLTARVVDLSTARARIIEATDAERRRLERDLHDGAQQRLVSLTLALGLARRKIEGGGDEVAAGVDLLGDVEREARLTLEELRELARGIHPAVLTAHGLDTALDELAGRASVPVEIEGGVGRRLPSGIEGAAYFAVSEALANVAKYARATHATIAVDADDALLRVAVADDGIGGADPAAGSGLRGLADRVGAFDGRLEVDSPPGGGTTVRVLIPLGPVSAPGGAPPSGAGSG